MKKKIVTTVVSAMVGLSLFGCSSVGFNVDTLMHPPKAIGDKAEIQELIDSAAGEGYTLKYPQSGSYRSAITMKDIDSDNIDEAIAFYLPVGDIATVHLMVMDNIDGKWQIIGNLKSQSSGIDSLSFNDLDGDGISEIVTTWKTYNSNINLLSVYIYENESVREVASDYSCSSLVTGDFAENDGEELLLLTLFSTEREANATLLTLGETRNVLSALGSSPLDPDVVSYTQLLTGNIFEGQFGATIDGTTATGEYSTQLLYFNSYFDSLERITFVENVNYNQALRSYPVVCKDIDGDNIIEVPNAFKLKSEANLADIVPAAEIYWCQQTENGTVHLDKHQAASFSYRFTFDIPHSWEDKFTAYTDHSKNEVTFYKWSKKKTDGKLLTIKMFPKDTADADMTGYTELVRNDSYIYTFSLADTSGSMLLTNEEIIAAFNLM